MKTMKPWDHVKLALDYTPSGILRDIRCGLIQSKYMCVGSWYTRSVEGVGGCLFGAAFMTQPTTHLRGENDVDEVVMFSENDWGKLFVDDATSHYERVYAEELAAMHEQYVAELVRRDLHDVMDTESDPVSVLISAYDHWGYQKSYRKVKVWPATKHFAAAEAAVLNDRGRNKLINAIEQILHERAFEVPECPADLFDGCLLAPREVVPA